MVKKFFEKNENEAVTSFICKILGVIAWLVTIFIIFTELGYDLSGLITGLGLGTAIISLAAQDTVKSLLSGVSILTDKPFIIGDWISVGTYAGSVKNISFRSTRIKCSDNSIVTIPNSVITSEYVINWSKLTSRRFDCTLNLKLEETSEKIKKITREIKMVLCNKEYIDENTVYVIFNKISAYSSDIKIFLYVKETDYFKYLKYQEDIYCSLLNILEKENIELAYPTETIHVRNVKDMGNDEKIDINTIINNKSNISE
jgi:MscS family membrane protein